MFGLRRKFKGLKTKDVPEEALQRQRVRLVAFMRLHPMRMPEAAGAFRPYALKPLVGAFTVLLVFSGTGGAVLASQGSLPGETLYPVKIASEEVRVRFALSEDAKFRYRSELAEKRLKEVEAIIARAETDVAERDRRVTIAMRRYEQHVDRLNGIAEKFEANDRPKDPDRAFEAMSRVLATHARLLESATATDVETDAAVAAYAEGAIDLEEKVMKRLEGMGNPPEEIRMRQERVQENMTRLREHLKEAETFRTREREEKPESEESDRWPKAWSGREWGGEDDRQDDDGDHVESATGIEAAAAVAL